MDPILAQSLELCRCLRRDRLGEQGSGGAFQIDIQRAPTSIVRMRRLVNQVMLDTAGRAVDHDGL